MLVHATTIDLAGQGVLIMGEPGAGKSDLALRLIGEGAMLVADDQTWVEVTGDYLRAGAPQSIDGLIELRGVGIIRAPQKRAARLRLAVTLSAHPERMPEPHTWSLPGTDAPRLPLLALNAHEASAPAKVRAALAAVPNA